MMKKPTATTTPTQSQPFGPPNQSTTSNAAPSGVGVGVASLAAVGDNNNNSYNSNGNHGQQQGGAFRSLSSNEGGLGSPGATSGSSVVAVRSILKSQHSSNYRDSPVNAGGLGTPHDHHPDHLHLSQVNGGAGVGGEGGLRSSSPLIVFTAGSPGLPQQRKRRISFSEDQTTPASASSIVTPVVPVPVNHAQLQQQLPPPPPPPSSSSSSSSSSTSGTPNSAQQRERKLYQQFAPSEARKSSFRSPSQRLRSTSSSNSMNAAAPTSPSTHGADADVFDAIGTSHVGNDSNAAGRTGTMTPAVIHPPLSPPPPTNTNDMNTNTERLTSTTSHESSSSSVSMGKSTGLTVGVGDESPLRANPSSHHHTHGSNHHHKAASTTSRGDEPRASFASSTSSPSPSSASGASLRRSSLVPIVPMSVHHSASARLLLNQVIQCNSIQYMALGFVRIHDNVVSSSCSYYYCCNYCYFFLL